MLGNCLVAMQLVASRVELCCAQLVFALFFSLLLTANVPSLRIVQP
jgi:hypothetical protein